MSSVTLDLTKYGIVRPEKVIWRVPQGVTDINQVIKSKTLRKFLERANDFLDKNSISFEHKILSQEDFENWLPFYHEKMTDNGYETIANIDWYHDRSAKGLIIHGLFFFQHGKIVGSGIYTQSALEKATFAFKASERIEISALSNASLGAVIDYFFLKIVLEQGVKTISAGKSRNLFGVYNTYGYLDYKLKFGYLPMPSENDQLQDQAITAEDGTVSFFGQSENLWKLYFFKPSNSQPSLDISKYLPSTIELTIIDY